MKQEFSYVEGTVRTACHVIIALKNANSVDVNKRNQRITALAGEFGGLPF